MPAPNPLRRHLERVQHALRGASVSRCPACGRAVTSSSSVRIHSAPFHRECALYRPPRRGVA